MQCERKKRGAAQKKGSLTAKLAAKLTTVVAHDFVPAPDSWAALHKSSEGLGPRLPSVKPGGGGAGGRVLWDCLPALSAWYLTLLINPQPGSPGYLLDFGREIHLLQIKNTY